MYRSVVYFCKAEKQMRFNIGVIKQARTQHAVFFLENFLDLLKIYNIDYQRFKKYFGKLYTKLITYGIFIWQIKN
jgi:hypothetical protein